MAFDRIAEMNCWSCQAGPGEGPLCGACGALQPVPPGLSAFALLGAEETFFLDTKRLEERFRELNRQLHPDRFARKSPRERRMSLEWTTAVNDAWRALKDPVRRAAYLLGRHGIDVDKDAGGSARQKPDLEFLEQVLEQREALGDAKQRRNLEQVRALAKAAADRQARELGQLEERLRVWEADRESGGLERAAEVLVRLRYHQRFLEEVEAIELEALDRD